MKCWCSQKKAKTKNKKQKSKKKKKKSKPQLDEKNLPFHDALDHFVFLYFINACQPAFALHNER